MKKPGKVDCVLNSYPVRKIITRWAGPYIRTQEARGVYISHEASYSLLFGKKIQPFWYIAFQSGLIQTEHI